jgi:hypothetical protein
MNKKYASAPIVFIDEEKRKEWEAMDPSIRREVYSLLHSCSKQMEHKIMIEMLCNIIIDMDNRIQDLERKDGSREINFS